MFCWFRNIYHSFYTESDTDHDNCGNSLVLCTIDYRYIRNHDGTEQRSVMTDYIGNVDADTDLVIEFGVKSTVNKGK